MTIRQPADPAQTIKDWLAVELPKIWPQVRVVLELPDDWELGADPVLVVADDAGPVVWPILTAHTIRIYSMTTGRDTEYVRRALGLLLSQKVPGIASILPGTSVIEARDKRTRGDLASATVRVRARTVVV
ncbi:hypothetical protein [Gordonia malaquae]|uniref:hypothetical protein n=1 Tax=Gordonia malaquae TaxID=410332 RepID=UPI003017C4FE